MALKQYALYKGEQLIADGTQREIADKVGLTYGHIRSLKLKKQRSHKYELVSLDYDEDEDDGGNW